MSKNRHNRGNHARDLEETHYPASFQELCKILKKAKETNATIRPIGSQDSLGSLSRTDGINIHSDRLNRILEIDKENLKVKVEGGIKICCLLDALSKVGLTLPNHPYSQDHSIAGAVATATHGSSGHTSTYSSFVLEIELVDADCNLHKLSPEKDLQHFSAAVVSLGCLGFTYSVTLRCVPLNKFLLTKSKTTFPAIYNHIDDYLQTYDSFHISKDPYSDELITWLYQKTDREVRNRLISRFKDQLLRISNKVVFDIFNPPYWIMPYLSKFYLLLSPMSNSINYSHQIARPEYTGHFIEEEIAIPLEHFETGLGITQTLIKRLGEFKMRPTVVVIIRFADKEPYGYLSPAQGLKTVYITLISIAGDGYARLFNEWEDAMLPLQGRPQWGKFHHLTRSKIVTLYGDNFVKFLAAKNTFDPRGTFSNAYIDNLFY